MPFPLEFIVEGTPLSLQAMPASIRRWRAKIQSAAKSRIDEQTDWYSYDERAISVTILCFLTAEMRPGDIDNLAKPILDAMNRTVYPDDRCVERLLIQKIEPGSLKIEPGTFIPFSNVTEQLALSLEATPPVVYVRIDDHLEWRRFT